MGPCFYSKKRNCQRAHSWHKVFVLWVLKAYIKLWDGIIVFASIGASAERFNFRYSIYNIHKECKMADFGRKHIPGFKYENGYYEFTQEIFLQPSKRIILVHKVSNVQLCIICLYALSFNGVQDKKLFTGGGAKFICAGDELNMDAVLGKKIVSPPDLTETEWNHIFIQSHCKEIKLLPGTKFLYIY